MISVVIPVRNKSISRLKRTINSFKDCDLIKEIIIVDYGSDKAIELSGKKIKIIRYDKNSFFNKSHAINLGIKAAKGDYIATIDADIIPSQSFLKAIKLYLNNKSFIYTRRVRRIQCKWFNKKLTWSQIVRHSEHWKQWRGVRWTDELSHRGTGGIQIYPTKWAHKVRGADENMVGMGGMDGEMLYRAYNTKLHIIQINEMTLHQEHPNMKESQFPPEQRRFLTFIRGLKPGYLSDKAQRKRAITNPGYWGEKRRANQKELINKMINIAKDTKNKPLLKDLKIIKLLEILKSRTITKAQFRKKMKEITKKKINYRGGDLERILQRFIQTQYMYPKENIKKKMNYIGKEMQKIVNNKLSKSEIKKKLKKLAIEEDLKIIWPKKK